MINDIQFHIDPGPGSLIKAKEYGINLRSNNVLLVSHAHLDHCNDVNAVVSAMTYDGLEKSGILIGSKSVVEGTSEDSAYLSRRHKKYLNNYAALEPGENVTFGNNVGLVTTRTKHRDESGIGFKVFSDKFVLGYVGDTEYFDTLFEEFKGVDILVVNNVLPFGVGGGDHMNSEDTVKLIDQIKPKLAIITHFGQKMLGENPIYQAREIQRRTGIQVIAARDGMVVNPITYSASVHHKSLNL